MTALTLTLVGGPTMLIEADGLRSRLQMLKPGVATPIDLAR